MILANSYSLDPGEECTIGTGPEATSLYYRFNVLLMLMTLIGFPEVLSLVYSLYKIVLKKEKEMNWRVFFWVNQQIVLDFD